jgi:hypothetical protein
MPDKMVVAIALEVPDDEQAKAKPPSAPRFNRVRFAAVPDNSLESIEPFIRDNVKREAILLTEDLESFLGLIDYC